MPHFATDARARMFAYGNDLVAEKRDNPGDDMLSIVVHATLDDADPPRLTDGELYMFFSLLFSAGAETTRNAIAQAVAIGLLKKTERRSDYAVSLPNILTYGEALSSACDLMTLQKDHHLTSRTEDLAP